jgi:hypothetical protein
VGSTVFYNHASELATVGNVFSVDGTPTDPTTISLIVTDPDGTAVTYTYAGGTITRNSAGDYEKDVSCTSTTRGTWQGVWVGTGTASDVAVVTWNTQSTDHTDLYVTPDALKLRQGTTDRLDDSELTGICRSVSRWIDEWCDRVFARRSITMELDTCGYYNLPVPDLVSVTTLKTDDDGDGVYETTWSASDYELQPVNAAVQVQPMPYTSIAAYGSRLFPVTTSSTSRPARAEIVGVFGWPSLPSAVAEAAALIAADYLASTGMRFGVLNFDGFAMRARMNGAALEMLRPYRLYPILVG